MKRTVSISLLVSVGVLAACGNDTAESPLLIAARGLLPDAGEKALPPSVDVVGRVALDRLKEPVMIAEMPSIDAVAAMVPYGQNGPVATWTTIEFQTVSLMGGRVIATRGLGADLMAVSGSDANRSYHLMNAANESVVIDVSCTARAAARETITLAGGEVVDTTRVDESCKGSEADFENSYWIGTGGDIRQSHQWIGPVIGQIKLQRLR